MDDSKLAVLASLAAALFCLAGCEKKSGDSSPSKQKETAQEKTQDDGPGDKESEGDGEKGKAKTEEGSSGGGAASQGDEIEKNMDEAVEQTGGDQ